MFERRLSQIFVIASFLVLCIQRAPTNAASFGCPDHVQCNESDPYRSINGSCNNLLNPLWGSAGIRYRRYIPSQYGPGDTPRGTGSNPPLPVPRQLTVALTSTPVTSTSNILSLLSMLWGQVISHDVNLTPGFITLCCQSGKFVNVNDSRCLALNVTGDAFFDGQFGQKCLGLTRDIPADAQCQESPREQVNSRSAYIDLSLVYGMTTTEANSLRTFVNGEMKIGAGSENITSCPVTANCPFTFLPSLGNIRFLAGDNRADQNPALSAMQIFLMRIHNGLASKLAALHPDYDDEKLYQEARRINIALEQHITYNEYLPTILGENTARYYDLLPLHDNTYFTGYSNSVDASLYNAFSASAFRVGHTQIADIFKLRNNIDVELSKSFFAHSITLTFGTYPSDFMKGIIFQSSETVDHFLAQSITNTLYAISPARFGSDLYSRNTVRGRDHGLAAYNEWRRYCGLSVLNNFSDLVGVVTPEAALVFPVMYASVNDIDLYPAGIAEIPTGDGVVGPTFSCLLGKQFRALKFGDRFFYEGNEQPKYFTFDQLKAIRTTSLASLICAFTNTEELQEDVMKVVGPGNPTKPCNALTKKFLDNFDLYW